MQPSPGDLFETAIWLSGEETSEDLRRWKEEECPKMKEDAEKEFGVIIGPIEFLVKAPGQDRVPQVPDHISGFEVKLLVAQAKVFAYAPSLSNGPGFVFDLERDDLVRLRKLTRSAHAKTHPGDRLTNAQCDAIINALGPEVAVRTLGGEIIH